jgi:hypothetical protein
MDITSIELIRILICLIYNFRIPRRSGHILNSRELNESYRGKNLEPLQSMHCWSSALSGYMSNLCLYKEWPIRISNPWWDSAIEGNEYGCQNFSTVDWWRRKCCRCSLATRRSFVIYMIYNVK